VVINAFNPKMNRSQNKRSTLPAQALATGGQAKALVAGRRQRRAAVTRLRLFRCALHLFAKRSFSSVTVEEITEAADVGKGTFFNYFESKEHVLGVMAEIQLSKMKEALTAAGHRRQKIQSVLHRLAQRLVEEPGRSPSLARAFISSFLASEGVRAIISHNMKEGRRMIAQIVAAGQERGEIDPNLKKDKVAMQLMQTCIGTVLLWSLDETPALKVRIENSFQHYWRAIALSGQEQKP
jgi:AcrR family transcriptional regulator